MELKRVLAADSRAAKEKAISLYGSDALILSNDRVNGQVELIVAVDLVPDDALYQTTERPAMTSASKAAAFSPLIQPPPFSQVLQGTMRRMRHNAPDASVEQQQAAATPQPQHEEREQLRARELVAMVKAELEEMRREIRISRATSAWEQTAGLSPAIQALAHRMREANVGAPLRALLIDEVKDFENPEQATVHLRARLGSLLKRKTIPAPLQGVHVIAGPSGAGKSCMVRNIASAHTPLYGNDDIAIISFNDNRVGAWPQLQLLGSAAGVECYKVKTTDALRDLVGSLSDKKLVIVDTPGSHVTEQITGIRGALTNASLHLVLPTDASTATIKRFLQIQGIRWDSLMLTKFDECTNPWPMLQMLNEETLAISFDSVQSLLGNAEAGGRTIEKMVVAGLDLLEADASFQPALMDNSLRHRHADAVRH